MIAVVARGFVATFRDGPLAIPGADRHFIGADDPFQSLYFIPFPAAVGWTLVGFTGLEPEPPWPRQVRYDLVRVFENAELNGDYNGQVAEYEVGSGDDVGKD